MGLDLQKAGIWKRIAAWMLDAVLFIVLAVGFVALFSSVLNYDDNLEQLNSAYEKYETEYGVSFSTSEQEYGEMTEEQRANYHAAYDALTSDAEAMKSYNLIINLTLVIITVSLLLTYLALEFLIPLMLGNGQTVGKKVFAIGLVRGDCVRVSNFQLLVRALLGKFTVETMIPVYIILMLFFGTTGMLGTILLGAIGLVQIIMVLVTKNNLTIHDYFAGTVAIDLPSQNIFASPQELTEYKKKLHAEHVARQDY